MAEESLKFVLYLKVTDGASYEMNWWNSLEKAGNISKFAITALKSAQQKIDEVLDITDEASNQNALPTLFEYSTRQVDATETLVSFKLNESSRCEPKPSGLFFDVAILSS